MTRRLDAAFTSPAAKAGHVRRLFATIADRYDLITRLLSFGLDARWKRRLVALRGGRAIGLDLTRRMVEIARAKPTPAAVPP